MESLWRYLLTTQEDMGKTTSHFILVSSTMKDFLSLRKVVLSVCVCVCVFVYIWIVGYSSVSQTLKMLLRFSSPRDLVKKQILIQGPRFCIFSKFSSDANTAGLWTTLTVVWGWRPGAFPVICVACLPTCHIPSIVGERPRINVPCFGLWTRVHFHMHK